VSGRCSPTEAVNILRPAPAFKGVVAAADKVTQATHAGLNVYVNGQKVHPGFLPHILVVGECQPDGAWIARVTSTVAIGGIGKSDVCEFEVDQVKALLPQPEPERAWPTVSDDVNWTPPTILASPQPDTRGEAMQAAAAAAEAATAEAATARAKLEQAQAALQAATERMEKAEERAEAARVEAAPLSPEINRILGDLPQRRSVGGRPPEHNWRTICGEIARHCHDPKTGRVRVPESERKLARDMLQWCLDEYNKEPADSEMRDAVSKVCAALRPLEKK